MDTTFAQPTTKCVSATFKEEAKVKEAIERLLNRGVPKENVSIIGRNFQSEARISGFITKKDIILDGVTTGALYGSVFGSLLSLLTGVGVLFIPYYFPYYWRCGPCSLGSNKWCPLWCFRGWARIRIDLLRNAAGQSRHLSNAGTGGRVFAGC